MIKSLLVLFVPFFIYANQTPVALIFGITGQDGSYLAELLLEKGYEVHGVVRRASTINTKRIDHLYQPPDVLGRTFVLHYGDLTDSTSIIRLIRDLRPSEIYNLAAQSHVKVSFETPEYTANTDALGTLRILEAIRLLQLEEHVRFYQASTSELFGTAPAPQSETTPFYPRSPYAVSKLFAYWATVNYREAYGIFACNGILFNHESPRRGRTFVTRKITEAAAKIALGQQECLYLGNLDAKRDWGYAKDYVRAMWLMLQQETPEDLVIATGETHSVRECVEVAFSTLGMDLVWRGSGIDEIGIDRNTGLTVVRIDPRYFRPTEVPLLLGDASKAADCLGWTPETTFRELITTMAWADYDRLSCRSN